MEKNNYKIEIFFESQRKSFVISSRSRISFDEIKQKTIREYNISKEFEKDMRFTVSINNRPITITNDMQIMKNLEETSKNNYHLKIIFNINNKNYIYIPKKFISIKINKFKPHNVDNFNIISNNENKPNENENDENKYKDEIKKLKEELEKLKNEKTTKGEFDIRKFDEKYRDLNNKNNILEQKITELEYENKTLKVGKHKSIFGGEQSFDNTLDSDYLLKEIEKCVSKLMADHENNINKEILELKGTVNTILNEQRALTDKVNNLSDLYTIGGYYDTPGGENINDYNRNEKKNDNINDNKDANKEEINLNKKIENINDNKDNYNDDNNIDIIKNNENINYTDSFNNGNNINDDNNNKFSDENDNFENEINNLKKIGQKEGKNDEGKKKILNKMRNKKIKKNIAFYLSEEDEKNSKSFNLIKDENEPKNFIKEIKNNFLENNNNINANNMKTISNDIEQIKKKLNKKKTDKKFYTKYTAPNKKINSEKMRIKNQKHILCPLKPELYEDELMNYESSSEIYSEIKKTKNSKINSSNSQKNFILKKEKKTNKFLITPNNNITPTPNDYCPSLRNKRNSFSSKKEIFITPSYRATTVKENIENFFITVFQSIFFYGNNGYVNMLNISDKLINKLKEGLRLYRNNLKDIKEVCIKYISFSIIPIVNDISTKEYQRKIIKSKIRTVSEILRIERNYFDKEYKEINEDKREKILDDKNINDINITHAKINEFRKLYDLKEKDYPDELIIKALIRYRGNRELAFQSIFY